MKSNFSLPSDIVAWPKPSADVLASQYPEIPIAARGPGWVLFDLRPLYQVAAPLDVRGTVINAQ